MSDDRLREMREHVGVDPDEVLRHPERYNRADRRLAARVVREREDLAEGLRQSAAGEVVDLGSFAQYVNDGPAAIEAAIAYQQPAPEDARGQRVDRNALGKLIWETSHADEQTISATGANIVADAILAVFDVRRKP